MTRVGLVLGAGGIVGHAYHAGTLAALSEHTGWDPRDAEVVVGTSAGSIVAALLRAGIPARDLYARLVGEAVSAETRQRLGAMARPPTTMPGPPPQRRDIPRPSSPGLLMSAWRLRPGVVAAGLLPEGRVDVGEIAAVVRPLFGDAWPARTLWLCAVRLSDGHRVVFGRDGAPRTDVATAVHASCAIPGWFAPVTVAGQRYVDGGAHSPTNADLLRRDPPDLVIVVSPMSAERGGNPLRRWHAVTLAREVAALKRAGAEVVTFAPTRADLEVMGVNAMDPSRRAAVARAARESAAGRLAKSPLPTLGREGRR